MSIRRILGIASGTALVLGLVVAAPAAASHLSCGQVITASTTLDADLFCPSGDGLVIQGDASPSTSTATRFAASSTPDR